MSKPYVLIGGGGHASVLCDVLLSQGSRVVSVVAPDPVSSRITFAGIEWLSEDESIQEHDPQSITLINAIGPLPNSGLRHDVVAKFEGWGYQFGSVISRKATVSQYAVIDSAVQILHGAVVQAGVRVGEHTVVNTATVVEHDCHVGRFNHLAPGSVLCGGVSTGDHVFFGANSTVLPGVKIGAKSIVGAGAVARRDLAPSSTLYPSRGFSENRKEIGGESLP